MGSSEALVHLKMYIPWLLYNIMATSQHHVLRIHVGISLLGKGICGRGGSLLHTWEGTGEKVLVTATIKTMKTSHELTNVVIFVHFIKCY